MLVFVIDSKIIAIAEKCLVCFLTDDITAGSNDYRQISDLSRTLVGNGIVDHSDVVGASPVGAAPTTSSFST